MQWLHMQGCVFFNNTGFIESSAFLDIYLHQKWLLLLDHYGQDLLQLINLTLFCFLNDWSLLIKQIDLQIAAKDMNLSLIQWCLRKIAWWYDSQEWRVQYQILYVKIIVYSYCDKWCFKRSSFLLQNWISVLWVLLNILSYSDISLSCI